MTIKIEGIIPGVFCDIEGTLLIDGKVNEKVLKILQEYAQIKNVNIWTGGDIEGYRMELAKIGINNFPILSKYDFCGCTVEIAIDDWSEKQLEKEYQITATRFIQIKKGETVL